MDTVSIRTGQDNRDTPTLGDVARKAGVGKAAASVVLSGSSSNSRVSEATRLRIRAAADDLGYRTNAIARSLRRQRTDIIGFYCGFGILDARAATFHSEIIKGLLTECDTVRRDLLLHSAFHVLTAQGVYDELANGKIDGLVLFAPPNDRLVELLAASSLPAVVVADALPSLPSVVVDDAAGAMLLAGHLAERGHRRILYRMGEAFVPGPSLSRRLATFHEAAQVHGMTVHEVVEAEWGWGLGAEERALLTGPAGQRPTAAVCWHDTSAYGLITACRPIGLRVPEDLAVVGFNGIETDASRLCKLTTIRAPWAEVGMRAVSLVIDMMAGKEIAGETMLPVEIVVGETT